MIKGAHHVAISVSNLERAIEFYRDTMGMDYTVPTFPLVGEKLETIMDLSDLDARMCVMRSGNLTLELFEFKSPAPAAKDSNHPVSDRGITHFGMEVEGIEAYYDRLAAAGVRFHGPIQTFGSGVKAAYGRDLDGNVFELVEQSQ